MHRGSNLLAQRILGLAPADVGSRRYFYSIPAQGEPRKLVHRIETGALDHVPGSKTVYLRWQELEAGIKHLLGGMKTVAMEYSPRNAIPYISRVDAGTIEIVRSLGVEIVSSGDLIQVFEQLADQTQIVYATHSLFLLNQNFPERHRLIVRDDTGTKVDQKPYRANWRYATDALGVHLTANILFSPSVLLVEGDSEPIYIYELFRQLNRLGKLDADANMLGIFSYENLPNLRFLLQTFRQNGEGTRVMVLCDGDKQGKQIHKAIRPLCEAREAPLQILGENLSIEDYTLDEECFLGAVLDSLATAADAGSMAFSEDDRAKIKAEWETHLKQQPRANTGAWFKRVTGQILKDKEGASKVGLARNYAFRCRENTPGRLWLARPN